MSVINLFLIRHLSKNGECRYSKYARAAYSYGYQVLPPGNENTLMHSVAAVGPVAVIIDANLTSFHKYKGGKFKTLWIEHDRRPVCSQ